MPYCPPAATPRLFMLSVVTVVALLLALSSSAVAAGTTDASTVQVRQAGALRCSGVVLAARLVLTANHCIAGRTSELEIRATSRASAAGQVRRVSKITRAPKDGGRRPDVALLELSAPVSVKPATLARAGGRLKLKPGGAVRAQGWRTAKSFVAAKARVVSKRSCKGAATSTLCVAGEVPARRCADAAGAVLTVVRRGVRVVVGVGSRGSARPAGRCSSRTRAVYESLEDGVVAKFVAQSLSPTSTLSVLAPYVGKWYGVIQQGSGAYGARVIITRDGTIREVVGTSEYVPTGCGGTLTYLGPKPGGGVDFVEDVTRGADRCLTGGTVTLTREGNSLRYSWVADDPAKGTSTGTLGPES